MNEFDLIKKYFGWGVDIGDDCGVFELNNQAREKNITSIDTLIQGVHFPDNTSPEDIAYKALAVNLSDIAAMGGVAKYFTLALSLPLIDEKWLAKFSASLKSTAQSYALDLIGGDTTKGNLSITISIVGSAEKPLRRGAAKVGDGIFVSGNLGGAALALKDLNNHKIPSNTALEKLNRPTPRLDLGSKISSIANACIDLSDGLLQDLSHILQASNVGASLRLNKIPIFPNATVAQALNGGDDYELCFTADINRIGRIEGVCQIGVITKEKSLKIDGKPLTSKGYQHF